MKFKALVLLAIVMGTVASVTVASAESGAGYRTGVCLTYNCLY